MGATSLSPSECSHCFNLRRDQADAMRARGDSEEVIASHLTDIRDMPLCRAHVAMQAEQLRKDRRRRGR